mmetsp:Transcript_60370/g.99872  ORF Transcript_60370/g.99872 Transcript_60370/m.99872 type:complete len:303 (+) Transcript_60370:314-1222(+)
MNNHGAMPVEEKRCLGDLVIVDLVQESGCIIWRIILNNFWRVAIVDSLCILCQLGSRFCLDLLKCGQSTVCNKLSLGPNIIGQNLGKLGANVLQHVWWRILVQQRLQSRWMHTFLDDALQCTLGLCLKIITAFLIQIHIQQLGQDASVCNAFGMVCRMAPNLTQRPCRSCLDVVFGFLFQRVAQRGNPLADNYRQRKRLGECRNVPQSHDTRQPGIATSLIYVINQCTNTAGIHNQLSQLWSVLCDFTDICCCVLLHNLIRILEQRENLGEDLTLHDQLCKLNTMLRNLGQTLANLSLQFSV